MRPTLLLACAGLLPLAAPLLGCAPTAPAPPPPMGDGGDPTWEPERHPAPPPTTEASSAPRNLLLVTVDTLRRDRIGMLSGTDTTPALDARLDEALVLGAHRSCSNWTLPAMTCLLSGAYPDEQGFFPIASQAPALPDDIPVLGEMLSQAGFVTALAASQPFILAGTNMFRGYQYESAVEVADADYVLGEARALLDRIGEGGERWMLHVHLFDPHLPFTADASWRRGEEELPESPVDLTDPDLSRLVADAINNLDDESLAVLQAHLDLRYDADLRRMDALLDDFLAEAEARGELQDTLVVLASDHGEQILDHGAFEHGLDIHGEETAGIVAFWSPGLDPELRLDATSHTQLLPTVLELLDLPAQPGTTGRSVLEAIEAAPVFSFVASEFAGVSQSVELHGDRLVAWWDGRFGLYRPAEDPGELDNAFHPEDPTVQALWALLEPRVVAFDEVLELWQAPDGGP